MSTLLRPHQLDIEGMISPDSGNLLQYRDGGLYAALQAAPNLQNQYVSSSTGNDANDGTRESPLKTIHQAIIRLPNNTSGTIHLLEGDVFPVKATGDPEWGSVIDTFGGPMGTEGRAIIMQPYGPLTDKYTPLTVNVTSFQPVLMANFNRPILEFGHFLFNGKPVGRSFIAGDSSSGVCTFYGCEFRWTQQLRDVVKATATPWTSGGYSWIVDLANGVLAGCILPDPVLSAAGATLNVVARFNGTSTLWNTSIPSGSYPWASIAAVSKVTFATTDTMVDNAGTSYATVPNTVSVNAASRIVGIARDANGIPRNISSNAVL